MKNSTPRHIVAELDKYIVGQADAKRAVAIAIRNRWRRQQLPENVRQDIWPKNILMIGPTGVGKTEIARRLAGLTNAPFIKIEANEIHWRWETIAKRGERRFDDPRSARFGDQYDSRRDDRTGQTLKPKTSVEGERLLDLHCCPGQDSLAEAEEAEETESRASRARAKSSAEQLRAANSMMRLVEINIEERSTVVGVLGQAGMEMDVEFQNMFEKMMPTRRESKRINVKDARKILFAQEAEKLVERSKITAEAIERVEQSGIIFLDELDKIAGTDKSHGPDVSRQGVQRDLLPIVEGSTVVTRYGPLKTDHILFHR